jgi:photosystem II stability/assembly factor-like uncharacterized protein
MRKIFSVFIIVLLLGCSKEKNPIFDQNLPTNQNYSLESTRGPYGGWINDIRVGLDGNLYVLSESQGGIFKSNNSDDSWEQLNLQVISTHANGLYELTFNSKGHIFAGAGKPGSILRSIDGGNNWDKVFSGFMGTRALAVNTKDELFAGIDFYEGGSYGILKSIDNGENWIEQSLPFKVSRIWCLEIRADDEIFLGLDDKLVRSSDNGVTWSVVEMNIPKPQIKSIAFDSFGNIYCSVFGQGIYSSFDNGNTWTSLNTGLSNLYVRTIYVNSNNQLFICTNAGLFHKDFQSNQWIEIRLNFRSQKVYPTVLIEHQTNFYIGTTTYGILKSNNSGVNWEQTQLPNSYVNCITIDKTNTIFANTFLSGVSYSKDHGENWQFSGLKDVDVKVMAVNSQNHIFAGGDSYAGEFNGGVGGMFRSVDQGNNWVTINNGLNTNDINDIDINVNDHLYIGTREGVFRSTNNGENWQITNLRESVQCVSINQSNQIFAGQSGKVMVSKDNGNSWKEIKNGLPDALIIKLKCYSMKYVFAITSKGVFRYSYILNYWFELSDQLSSAVNSICLDSFDNLIVGGWGINISTDLGDTWTFTKDGLKNNIVVCVASAKDGFSYAGTKGGSIYRISSFGF